MTRTPVKQVSGILTISCPDRRGIVAAVTTFLAQHGANVIEASQHSDLSAGAFFMRTEFELAGLDLARNEVAIAFELSVARRFEMTWSLNFSDQPLTTAILVSKLDHCFYDLLLRQRAGDLRTNIALIISNHDTLQSVAENFGIPFYYLPVDSTNRPAQETRIAELLTQYKVDLIVLARYMQILSPDLVARYPNQIINIHHSFLPAFVGGQPYHQAYKRGVKMIGATSHYVTNELDEGPIIAQDVTQVSHRESVEDLIRKGRDVERLVLARAVRAHLDHRVIVYGRRTVVFD